MMNLSTLSKTTRVLSGVVTTVAVLAFSVTVGVLTLQKNGEALFFATDPETGETASVKQRITDAFDENIVGFDRFLSIYGISQRLLGTSVYEDAGYTYLIRDADDGLHYHTTRTDAAPYADAVAAFRDRLAAHDIPLVYLQAPTKEIDGYTDYPPGIDYESVENAADMLASLCERGVTTFSFTKAFLEAGIPPETQFYRTDHHWTTQSAFEAVKLSLPLLSETIGVTLDATLYDDDRWTSLYQPQSFLGSIGRRIGAELAGLDDYTYLEPVFETAYDVFYPPTSREVPYWSGSFHHTMVRDKLLYAEDVAANRYATYFQYDYAELIIKNKKIDNGVKLAIVKDSFALPYTAFLSCAVSEITMIDLREFEGSVTDFLIDYDPDAVIILYGNGSFSNVMYQFED